ncbi:MAG: phage tail assembly chaperone [Oxalobacter formigenes]|nr:phage tail assembly chaperone [Oxalobacter formigenes]
MTKILYEYSPKTGEFIGENFATESPLEPGKYLSRSNATFTAPPEAGEHEIPVWKNGQWEIVPDWRGTTYYLRDENGQIQQTEIKELGQIVPDEAYLNRDDVPKTEEEKAAEARAERDRRLAETDLIIIRCAEAGEPVPDEWKTYRQALRDIPEQTGFPENVVWPEKPGEESTRAPGASDIPDNE